MFLLFSSVGGSDRKRLLFFGVQRFYIRFCSNFFGCYAAFNSLQLSTSFKNTTRPWRGAPIWEAVNSMHDDHRNTYVLEPCNCSVDKSRTTVDFVWESNAPVQIAVHVNDTYEICMTHKLSGWKPISFEYLVTIMINKKHLSNKTALNKKISRQFRCCVLSCKVGVKRQLNVHGKLEKRYIQRKETFCTGKKKTMRMIWK